MSKALTTLLFSCILFSLSVSSNAQTCKSYSFSSNRVYASCQDLPVLSAFLHYNYSSSANTLDIAYRVTGATTSNWISWAINPNGQQMAGSQALVAFQNSSGAIRAFTSSVASTSISTLSESTLSFGVSNLAGSFVNGEMTIFATLTLSSGMTTVNQVWQVGPVSGDNPQSHDTSSSAANLRSVGTLNLLNGTTSGGTS